MLGCGCSKRVALMVLCRLQKGKEQRALASVLSSAVPGMGHFCGHSLLTSLGHRRLKKKRELFP